MVSVNLMGRGVLDIASFSVSKATLVVVVWDLDLLDMIWNNELNCLGKEILENLLGNFILVHILTSFNILLIIIIKLKESSRVIKHHNQASLLSVIIKRHHQASSSSIIIKCHHQVPSSSIIIKRHLQASSSTLNIASQLS